MSDNDDALPLDDVLASVDEIVGAALSIVAPGRDGAPGDVQQRITEMSNTEFLGVLGGILRMSESDLNTLVEAPVFQRLGGDGDDVDQGASSATRDEDGDEQGDVEGTIAATPPAPTSPSTILMSISDHHDVLRSVTDYLERHQRLLLAVAMAQPQTGSAAAPYRATSKQEGSNSIALQAITAMPLYEQKSLEELRLEDYMARNEVTTNMRLSAASRAIISSKRWDTLNFSQLDKEVASRLRDEDIRELLLCVNAGRKLKRLSMENCTNVVGHGLEPLRQSLALEQIDLGIGASIDAEATVPILQSIVEEEFNSLKHLRLPASWSQRYSPMLRSFIMKYSDVLDRRFYDCAGCEGNDEKEEWCEGTGMCLVDENATMGTWLSLSDLSQAQEHTCCECLRNYCTGADADGKAMNCRVCRRRYCAECISFVDCIRCCHDICPFCKGEVETMTCDECNTTFCKGHRDVGTCKVCSVSICRGCLPRLPQSRCNSCYITVCEGCVGTAPFDLFDCCRKCDNFFCEDCLVQKGFAGKYCSGCKDSVIVHESGCVSYAEQYEPIDFCGRGRDQVT